MEKKRSVGMTVFGWFEILTGAIGSIFFLMSLDLLLRSFHYLGTHIQGVYTIGVDINTFDTGFLYCLMTFPYLIVFLLGIGTLLLSSLARKINIMLAPIVLVVGLFFIYLNLLLLDKDIKWRSFLLLFIPLFMLTLSAMYFFTRPKVKEQFAKRR